MITNDRQYKITKAEVDRFRLAIAQFSELDLLRQGIDPAIISAQKASLGQQLGELEHDLARYEGLKSSSGKRLFPSKISDIGEKLIEARVMQGLSQKALAERLSMKEQQIQRYEQERYLSANLTRVAEVAEALDLDLHAFFDVRNQKRIDLIAPNLRGLVDFDPGKLPVRLMRKRGWLDKVQLPSDLSDPSEIEIAAAFISQATQGYGTKALHLQRVRAGSKQDKYALTAWKAEVLRQARTKTRKGHSNRRTLDAKVIHEIVGLSRHQNGPLLAVDLLQSCGVVVVFVEHLPATHLDGAAMLLDNTVPVIGITLRFDRLDSFWWVLLHELGHVMLHRDSGLRDGFFDDTESPAVDKLESDADLFAESALISKEVWTTSFVRFAASKDQIVQFANNQGVSPSIVAGRLRRERRDYTIFANLVGQGEVRKLVSAAGFWEM